MDDDVAARPALPAAPYRPAFTRTDAAIYGSATLASILVITVAWFVEPAPRGFGTHERLGLPPCLFLRITGRPCPSCGLTTCFSQAAKLQFRAAARTHPFGLLQFGLTVAAIPWGVWLLVRRMPLEEVVRSRATLPVLWTWLGLYLLGWLYKVLTIS